MYQKAYCEFFCSPATWALLEEHLEKTPTVELMGVTRKGELKAPSNTQARARTHPMHRHASLGCTGLGGTSEFSSFEKKDLVVKNQKSTQSKKIRS